LCGGHAGRVYAPPGAAVVAVDAGVVVGEVELAVFGDELEQPVIAAATASATGQVRTDFDNLASPRSGGRLAPGRACQCARRQNAPSQSIGSTGSTIPCASR